MFSQNPSLISDASNHVALHASLGWIGVKEDKDGVLIRARTEIPLIRAQQAEVILIRAQHRLC